MDNQKTKSFWKKPEGWTGRIFLTGIIGGGIFALYKALPYIITLLENTLYAVGLGAALFVIVVILSDKRFRTSMWYLYKTIMRKITGFIVQLNPIAILEAYVYDLKEKMNKIEEQLLSLKGQMGKVDRKILEKEGEIKKKYDLASAARKQGLPEMEVGMYATQAERLAEFHKKLTVIKSKMDVIYKVLNKMKDYSRLMIQSTEFEVEIKKEEFETMSKSHNIMKTAFNIIQGNDDKKLMFDEAMEFVLDDIGHKTGEMERMLEATTDFINTVDLENAVFEDRGMKFLEELDKKGMETMLGKVKTLPEANTNYLNNSTVKGKEYEILNKNNQDSGKKNKYFDKEK